MTNVLKLSQHKTRYKTKTQRRDSAVQIVLFYQGTTLGRVGMPKVTQLAGGRAEMRILGPWQDNLVTEVATQGKFLLNSS